MKKMMILLLTFLVVFVAGCSQTDHTLRDNSGKADTLPNTDNDPSSIEIDLSAILEIDGEQLNIEAELNHNNLISAKPQYFSADNIQKIKELTLNDIKYNLTYKDSIYYPVGSKTVHRYIVSEDESKTILVDDKGNIDSILYEYTKLNIAQKASPEEVFESLKMELSKMFDISYYKNIKLPDSNQKTDGFGIYDYLFYNNCDEYITDYLIVSVSDDGSVFGLKINNLSMVGFKFDIDKSKADAAIELKLKDIYDTNVTQYQSYTMPFPPCIVQYNNQVYVRYFITAKYLDTQNIEMNSYINDILIPLNEISN